MDKLLVIPPEQAIDLKDPASFSTEIEIMQKNYEDLLFSNVQLKSDILNVEGQLTKQRKLEVDIKILTEKCDFFERVNKELTSKKNNESDDDSLDLDCSNIKDAIEIQELRAALRSISERYEQEKETILRDCEESRQDMETQMFRLRNEKAYIEVKFRDIEKLLSDVIREKEKQDGIILNLKKDIERLKDSKNNEISQKIDSRRGSDDVCISDFELTESVDKFGQVNSNDLYELLLEEINEIALEIANSQILSPQSKISKNLIYKLIDVSKKNKELITKELGNISNKGLDELLIDTFNKFKQRINALELDKAENEAKKEEYVKYERLEVQSEPSPRGLTPNVSIESSLIIKKELQMIKLRLDEKKHKIYLHKQQITSLKKNIRELQIELYIALKVYIIYLRELWINLNKEIQIASTNGEKILEIFMKMLGFNSKEIICLHNERNLKKSRGKHGIFG